jgi:hypothetical protein
MAAARSWCVDLRGRQLSGRSTLVAALAAFASVWLGGVPLGAQELGGHPKEHPGLPLHALALNALDFGTIFPGIPSSVSAFDGHHAGAFQVRGSEGASVRVEFVLPPALLAEDGARLPIDFGPRDGYADFSGDREGHGRRFDPHAPVLGCLGEEGRLYLRIGGTVRPDVSQRRGRYRATIFLTVFDLGS